MESKPTIDELLTRGVEAVYPNEEFVREKLEKGEPFRLYLGIDPTGPTLHLGHAIILKKLRDFQAYGAEVVLLIGDFTALIGDPTGRDTTRPRLSPEEIKNNGALYKEQAATFLRFSGDNPAKLRHNSEWLSALGLSDILEIAGMVTVGQMLERDMFQRRIQSESPIFLHEFMYPLLQGYDSVALETDGEIGGTDQTFNMLVGRTLERQMSGKEKAVITMQLLTDVAGAKMGKTEGNMLTLKDAPEEMFGKVMGWTDEMIIPAFKLITDVPLSRIEEIERELSGGKNPRDTKQDLAESVAALFYSEEEARAARDSFNRAFAQGGVPETLETHAVSVQAPIVDTLLKYGVVSSKTDFRRLVGEGAVRDMESGEKIENPDASWEKSRTLRIGKHRFFKAEAE